MSLIKRQNRVLLIAVSIALVVAVWALANHHAKPGQTKPASSQATSAAKASGLDKKRFSLTDPTSVWVIVNKTHPLVPATYVPNDLVVPDVPLRVPGNETMQLRAATAQSLVQLFRSAKTSGINLMLASGYRSHSYQVSLYNGYVQSQGQAAADTLSARPGYSEHQTGLAADVEPLTKKCELDACFKDTPEGQWVAANAYKFGFIIRYSADKTAVTGYAFEPWHIRYVGAPLALELHNAHVETLEEFFHVRGGTAYAN
jgi:D-alanyl-D-alanine carboxypeptidase